MEVVIGILLEKQKILGKTKKEETNNPFNLNNVF